MKKLIALLLALVLVMAMTACGNTPAPETQAPTDEPKPTETEAPTDDPASGSAETVEIVVSEYFADDSKWEDDGGYHERDEAKLFFDNLKAIEGSADADDVKLIGIGQVIGQIFRS